MQKNWTQKTFLTFGQKIGTSVEIRKSDTSGMTTQTLFEEDKQKKKNRKSKEEQSSNTKTESKKPPLLK